LAKVEKLIVEGERVSEMRTELRILLIALAAFLALVGLSCEGRNVTDSTITTKVKSKLAMDTETSALSIGVETNNGVVTLTGKVPTQAEKTQAEQIARNTEGVTRIINNITVEPAPTGKTGIEEKAEEGARDVGIAAEDLTILSKIKARYVAEDILGTNVEVKDGVVTLKGNVENAQEKARAESIAKATSGVKSVNNMITIKQ
jgi:hyperosmotically inducible protein